MLITSGCKPEVVCAKLGTVKKLKENARVKSIGLKVKAPRERSRQELWQLTILQCLHYPTSAAQETERLQTLFA